MAAPVVTSSLGLDDVTCPVNGQACPFSGYGPAASYTVAVTVQLLWDDLNGNPQPPVQLNSTLNNMGTPNANWTADMLGALPPNGQDYVYAVTFHHNPMSGVMDLVISRTL